ncbi:MAG TPA: hypothetical protein VK789_23840 [Bryobacteraceae bacterium]|nr:hypothetical protein [Bryobacteraceae bacterium]
MKRAWLVAALILLASNFFAAGIPDFSGLWKIDTLQNPLRGSGYKEFANGQTPSEIRIGYPDETLT